MAKRFEIFVGDIAETFQLSLSRRGFTFIIFFQFSVFFHIWNDFIFNSNLDEWPENISLSVSQLTFKKLKVVRFYRIKNYNTYL